MAFLNILDLNLSLMDQCILIISTMVIVMVIMKLIRRNGTISVSHQQEIVEMEYNPNRIWSVYDNDDHQVGQGSI